MSRKRKKEYIDIRLSEKKHAKLVKGRSVLVHVKGLYYCISKKKRPTAIQRKIDKLQAKIRELKRRNK